VTRCLVIGGTGFIGTAACKELMRRGVEVIATSRTERPYGTFTSHRALDRHDEDALARVLADVQPDVVLDMVAYQGRDVAAVLRHLKGARYVLTSTGSVYPELHGRPAREEEFVSQEGELPQEDLDYANAKRWCETLLVRQSDVPWVAVRPPIVIGPGDPTLRIAAYLQRIEDGGPVLVARETVDWPAVIGWVRDVGFVLARAVTGGAEVEGRTYNVGFEGVSVRSFLEAAAAALDKPLNLAEIPAADLPWPASPYCLGPDGLGSYPVDRARAELGFEPSGVGDCLADTLPWYRSARPSHKGYAEREQELKLAAGHL
jgi:nucleoside-diphosphate-sugar epimerase